METIAVFINDAPRARHLLQSALDGLAPTHWILIGCPPRLTRHLGRWVSHGARDQWRERWAAELFGAVEPMLAARTGSRVETLVAKRALVDVSSRLLARFPKLRMIDARQSRVGRTDERIVAAPSGSEAHSWAAPAAAAAGISLVLALAD